MKRGGLLKNHKGHQRFPLILISPRSKRGISTTIEYVLFISLAITMSLIVYVWLKSYIPKDALECSDGVSILLQDYDYNCNADIIKLDLKNNGRFNIDGYFIKATNSSTQTLAIKDLAKYTDRGKGNNFVNYKSPDPNNPLAPPGATMSDQFLISSLPECQPPNQAEPPDSPRCIYSLEIIPLKVETINERTRTLSCTSAKIRQDIGCTAPQACTTATESTDCTTSPYLKCKTPDNICVQCLGDANCGGATPACTTTNVCVECTATNDALCTAAGKICDTTPGDSTYQTCVAGAPSSSCDGTWNAGSEDAGVVCDTLSTTDQCKDSTDPISPCICNAGYHADGTGGCVGNIDSLFFDGFSATNPLQYATNPWASECLIPICDNDDIDDIISLNMAPVHNDYYVSIADGRGIIKSIPVPVGSNNIKLSYWRRTDFTGNLKVEWMAGTSGSWNTIENANPGSTWLEKTSTDLTGAEGQSTLQLRFSTTGNNNVKHAFFDDITVTRQVI